MDEMPKTERPNILFVDDEENVLRSLLRLFIDEECVVFTATSAREGLEIVAHNEIAVVVSDQAMPEMRGTEFLALVEDLRSSEASMYTLLETPIFTCRRVDPSTMLSLLG